MMKIPSLGFPCLVVHELLDRVVSCLVLVPQIIQQLYEELRREIYI